jgi:hypothetical protein
MYYIFFNNETVKGNDNRICYPAFYSKSLT